MIPSTRWAFALVLLSVALLASVTQGEDNGDGPVLVIVEPLNGALVNQSVQTVRGYTEPGVMLHFTIESSWYDAYPDLRPDIYMVPDPDGTFEQSIKLSEGVQKLVVEASRMEGNTTTVRLSIVLDMTVPEWIITRPPEVPYWTKESTYSIVASTRHDGPSRFYINGHEIANTGTVSVEVSLNEGNNTFELMASDRAGNAWTRKVLIVRDTTPPVLNMTTPLETQIRTNIPYLFVAGIVTGAKEDGVSLEYGEERVKGTLLSGDWATLAVWSYETRLLKKDQAFTVLVRAVDNVSNEAYFLFNFTVDITPPVINIVPIPYWNWDMSVDVVGTTEPGIGSVLINDVVHYIQNGSFSTTVDLMVGMNIIVIEAVDEAGNLGQLREPVGVDRTAPETEIDAPRNSQRPIVTIKGRTSSDARTVVVDDTEHQVVNGTFEVDVSLREGWNRVSITVIDRVGNIEQKDVQVYYEEPNPNGLIMVIAVLLVVLAMVLARGWRVRTRLRTP
jgi:hypothetical protein